MRDKLPYKTGVQGALIAEVKEVQREFTNRGRGKRGREQTIVS